VGDRENCIFSGTMTTKGSAKAVVLRTGMDTETGQIAEMISTSKKEKTPLQKKLKRLGKILTIIVISISVLVFGVGLLKGYFNENIDINHIKEMLISSIALAVAAIPEGLPAVVTISLALGVRRMVKRNALIRRLPSVETLGATTVICADKTGTLTHNQMTVKKLFVNDKTVKVSGRGYKPEGEISEEKNIKTLLEIGALCNNSELEKEKKKWKVEGDPTEGALLVSAKKAGIDIDKLKEKKERKDEIGFSSERKRMTTIHSTKDGNIAYMKGAPDVILKLCSKILINGKEKKLSEKKKKEILEKNEDFTKDALRVLGFAYKKIDKKYDKEKVEEDFIFVGLQAMIDPPREEVKKAIKKCETAGIKVIMITGDHKNTAVAIGKQLGIKGKSIEGTELDKMSDKELKKKVEEISVYARVNPKHKVKILKALRSKKHVIGMTGDGVNDAPALKKADIGIAMGITGTEVSKEASDMILTDDNFASIVNAVEEGRRIFDNIRKFVMYLLSSNAGEVLVVFIGIILGKLPILALQILWINIATDGLPALALSVEPPEKDIMKRKPKKKKESVLTKERFYLMTGIGIVMMLGTLGIFRYYPSDSLKHARTMAFTTLVLFQLFNVLNLQSEEKSVIKTFLRNKWLLGAIASSLILQLIILYIPYLNNVFKTTPLTLFDWLWILIATSSILLFGELVKLIIYLRKKK
ncbi:HAD-IC family P-type ATPase, partial [Candidatus Peregrinibacteria bacterium]|nr:HAD-IC family P-type ATPase [Candidatus Peregrinibacteria bacterium]